MVQERVVSCMSDVVHLHEQAAVTFVPHRCHGAEHLRNRLAGPGTSSISLSHIETLSLFLGVRRQVAFAVRNPMLLVLLSVY